MKSGEFTGWILLYNVCRLWSDDFFCKISFRHVPFIIS